MKLLPHKWFFIFLLVGSQESLAQTQSVKFNLVSGSNGISVGKINGMTRDKYGFMWFSDQSNRCIIRYDGNKMVRYQNIVNDPNTLGGAYPEFLFADSSGIIWIGFYGMGLDRFDPQANTFTHYRHKKDDPESLINDYVSAVLVDHLGNIWLGTDGGLDLLDERTGKFKHYHYKADDPSSLSNNYVRNIYEDKAGELWIGTGYPWSNNDEGGLNRFNRKTGTFTRYLHDPKNPHSLIDNHVRAIFEDSQGNFWIGTKGDGLHTMERKTGLITRHTYDAAKPEQLSRPPVKSGSDHITFIREDAERKLWIGTFENGISRYDPETNKMTHYTEYEGNTSFVKDTSSWWAHATPDGLIWLSTQSSNLYRIDLYNNIVPHIGNSGSDGVSSFCQESSSVLWMGTPAGLVRKDLSDGTVKHFTHEPANFNSISGNNISDIIKDKRGDLWIGTRDAGLNRFNPITKTFTRYFNDPVKDSNLNDINVLFEGRDSTIWVGTSEGGVIQLNPNTGKIIQYDTNENDDSSLGSSVISSILEADSIYMWFGSPSTNGLNRLNRQTGKFKLYLPGLSVHCLYIDKDGVIWVGSEGGLYRYDKEADVFYSGAVINDALNIPNAFSIISDNENNLWIVSSPGIYKINRRRDHATLYSKESGIAQGNQFYTRSSYKTQDGKLYFGNFNGYFSLYPDKIDNKPFSTQLYFTNFWLNNKEIRSGENSLLKHSIFETKEIFLTHDQNVFSFGFSVVDFREGDKRVFYTLESYDNGWRTAGSENKAEYYKVPPGKYVFRIKTASSSNGEWIEKEIHVIITPPWWRTWWASVFYGLCLLAGIYFTDRIRKKVVIERERAKTKERELAQAKEIEKAYTQLETAHENLKSTQSQLIQSEKMASLGELTAGIAHEIQNPLNFVNNFSEINTELSDELSEAAQKGDLQEIIQLANDIKSNQEKISEHGKRADAIVKGMLQHSRSGSGIKEPTNINALADEYLRLAYHGLRAKDKSFNATMKTDFDETIGNINIIPQDIGRVVLNLINNAFYVVDEKKKQQPVGYEPTVTVSTKKVGDKVEVRVKDNGNGIPQKVLDKIFQPFFTTKPTGQGTGLGLSLSYDIVKAHGGEIKVESKDGEGSEFIVQLLY